MCVRFYTAHEAAKRADTPFGLNCGLPEGEYFPMGRSRIIRVGRDRRRALLEASWGLLPRWAKDPALAKQTYNARSETIMENPTYRDAFARHRCIVPAHAFYERGRGRWFRFARADSEPFAMAGLYEGPIADGQPYTFTIATTEPCAKVAEIHDRMPVILDPADIAEWLDREHPQPKDLLRMLVPCDSEQLVYTDDGPIGKKKAPDPGAQRAQDQASLEF